MADDSEKNTESVSQNPDQYVKLCKRRLESWREVLIHLNAVLTWEKPYYPGITAGFLTLKYLILWYLELSVLTTLSIFGIILCLLDYFVPLIGPTIFDSSKWTGAQEKKYEKVCHDLVNCFLCVKEVLNTLTFFKESKPCLYVVFNVGVLIFLAWIGNLVNNLFLIYILELSLLLSPGFMDKHTFRNMLSTALSLVGQSKKKK